MVVDLWSSAFGGESRFEAPLVHSVFKCSLYLRHLKSVVRGTEMHSKSHLSPGACSLAETACKCMAERGEGLKSPGKCYGWFEEAEVTFGSRKQSRLCGRGGSTFIHALFIKYF